MMALFRVNSQNSCFEFVYEIETPSIVLQRFQFKVVNYIQKEQVFI